MAGKPTWQRKNLDSVGRHVLASRSNSNGTNIPYIGKNRRKENDADHVTTPESGTFGYETILTNTSAIPRISPTSPNTQPLTLESEGVIIFEWKCSKSRVAPQTTVETNLK
jgi:hypothetical protein